MNPGAVLDVNGGTYQTGIRVVSNSSLGAGVTVKATDSGHEYNFFSTGTGNSGGAGNFKIYDATAAATRLTITGSGTIGLGTPSPAAFLDVYGTGSSSAMIVPRDTTANRPPTGVNGMLRYNTDLAKLELYGSGAWSSVATGASGSGTSSQWISNSTSIYYSSGSVGIGTSSPNQALEVSGKITTSNAVSAGSTGDLNVGQNGMYSFNGSSRYVRFNTSGDFNDLQSAGKPLVINYDGGQNVNFFGTNVNSATMSVGSSGYPYIPTGSRFIVYGNDTSAGNSAVDIRDSSGASKFFVRNDGNVGIGTNAPAATLHVAGAIVSAPVDVATGATANLAQSNTITLDSVGGTAITLSNMVHGGNYTLVITDTNPRQYTFSGCTNSYFRPANATTTSGTQTIYNLLTIKTGANWNCYITWATGYQ